MIITNNDTKLKIERIEKKVERKQIEKKKKSPKISEIKIRVGVKNKQNSINKIEKMGKAFHFIIFFFFPIFVSPDQQNIVSICFFFFIAHLQCFSLGQILILEVQILMLY
jgi:uncharacterized protein YjaZ